MKILVPTDFSDVSTNAVHFAIDLAKKVDGEITLFNSIHFDYFQDYQYGYIPAVQTMADEVKGAVEKRMDQYVAQFATGVPIEKKISAMSMVTAIKDMVKEEDFDLVVIGTHGSSGMEEVFVGSNTERIVRHAPCPVISVPHEVHLQEIKKILVPIDLRELRASFFQQIARLQKFFNSELEFIWVKTPHNIENEEQVGQELAAMIESFGIDNYKFFIVKNIFPTDGIFLEANESEADMVAMATHARRGLSHWLTGSMTEDTVNHLEIPVWSFRIDKKDKVLGLDAVAKAKGTPLYKKLDVVL